MAAVPIYVWNGSAWQETGPTIPANPIKYQTTAPSSPSTGDIWVDSDGDVTTGSQQFQRFRFVASGGETTISGADANGAVLAYTAGLEQVVLNGAVLVRGHDYTATTGTTITGLSPALVASDVLEVFSFIAFTVANTYTQSQVDGLLDSYVGLRLITPTSATNGTVGSSGAVTVSGASSVSLDGVFSSTYDNYKIIVSALGSSTQVLNFKLRASGTGDDSNNIYYYSGHVVESSSTAITLTKGDPVTTGWRIGAVGTDFAVIETTISAPNTSNKTSFNSSCGYGYGTNEGGQNLTAGFFSGTTVFTGFSIIPASGTITGTVRVYGFKN